MPRVFQRPNTRGGFIDVEKKGPGIYLLTLKCGHVHEMPHGNWDPDSEIRCRKCELGKKADVLV